MDNSEAAESYPREKPSLPPPNNPARSKISPTLATSILIGNAVSTVSLVYINKVVLNQLPLPLTLTFVHQIAIWGLTTMLLRGEEEPEVDMWSAWTLGGGISASLILGNLSLRLNNIGVYQLLKVLVIPLLAGIEVIVYKKRLIPLKPTVLMVMVMGVGFATFSPDPATALGMGVGLLCAVMTALNQGYVQQGRGIAHLTVERLRVMSPIACLIMGVGAVSEVALIRIIDPQVLEAPIPLTAILLSSAIALPCSWSALAVIGKLSALTFQVTGNVKTTSLVLLSMIAEPAGKTTTGSFTEPRQIVGAIMTISASLPYAMIDFEVATFESVMRRRTKVILALVTLMLVVVLVTYVDGRLLGVR